DVVPGTTSRPLARQPDRSHPISSAPLVKGKQPEPGIAYPVQLNPADAVPVQPVHTDGGSPASAMQSRARLGNAGNQLLINSDTARLDKMYKPKTVLSAIISADNPEHASNCLKQLAQLKKLRNVKIGEVLLLHVGTDENANYISGIAGDPRLSQLSG